MDLELKGDAVGLLALDHGLDTGGVGRNKYGGGVNDETGKLAAHGFDLQAKSKEALLRTLGKVHDTNALANDAVVNLEKQNEQILRITDKVQKIDTTLQRTKKHLKYFSKSFCQDKTALTLMFMIFVVSVAIIVVANMEGKVKPAVPDAGTTPAAPVVDPDPPPEAPANADAQPKGDGTNVSPSFL